MPQNHEYDDLFASYERRTKGDNKITDEMVEYEKKLGYTSSSSYSKHNKNSNTPKSSKNHSKSKTSSKTKRDRTPEKSQKTYYGGKSYEENTKRRRLKKNALSQSEKKVKFNYNSLSDRSAASSSAENYAQKLSYSNASKDEYRQKYERHSKERSPKSKKASFIKNKGKNNKNAKIAAPGFKKTLIFLIAVIAASTVLSLCAISCVNDILAINRHSEKSVTITIDKQVDTHDVIKMLKKNGLIKNELFCNLFAKFRGYTDNYQTGVFYLNKDMGLEGMITELKETAQTDETISINFPEGYSVIDIANKLEANEVCKAKNFIDTLENYNFEYDFITDKMKSDKRKYMYLEGYLFPATYEFYIGESPSSVIKKMLDAFNEHYLSEFKPKLKNTNLTMDEVVTFASIIQREAANKDQMSQIASVLNNRLNEQGTFPRLECDSTTSFLNDDVKEFLKLYPDKGTIDYYALYYSTYNNSFAGLPAGAICNPGADAINAVLTVRPSDYYYFCHDSSGEIHLASTLYEFEYILNEYGIEQSKSN